MKNLMIVLLGILSISAFSQSPDKLWYNQPAKHFEESLVLGNGTAGASVFGGVESDKIYLNDITLWSGGPVDPYMNPEAYKNIPAIREALANEDYQLADQLQKKVQGKFSESFAPLGTMYLNSANQGKVENYYRELDISNAVSKVIYEIDGVKYTREYFISNPDQVFAIKLNSSEKGKLDFELKFDSQLKYKIKTGNNEMLASGYAPTVALPSYLGNKENAVVFDETKGTRFASIFTIKNTGGELVKTDSSLVVKGATEAVVLVSIATSFNGFDKDPVKQGKDYLSIASSNLKKASAKSFEALKKEHIADYQHFYKRVELQLGATTAPNLPTNERLKRYAEGKEDKNLEILYFQFGRYLLIASSRTPGVPANLQGLWNPYIRPPWSSNYTININAEENYWGAESTNLSEMHNSLLTFVHNLSKTGEVTAKTFFGVQKGWAACHNSDIWAMSNPVGNFGEGDPVWANWYMGGTWLSTHIWEHYIFTQNKEWLKNEGYPVLKGAAEFCLGWLVEDKNGKLIPSPSTSPEQRYINDKGYRGATLYGGTADLAMIRSCFENTIDAAKALDKDAVFVKELETALVRLHPSQVGKKGNLQEWYYDWEDAEPQHRHQSHLFGLHPGHHITPLKTPELAAACAKTLNIKGDETTGWSKGWRINLWARLLDGNRAYKMIRELLKYVDPSGTGTNMSNGGGTYPNLFDAHPPFQIDGNFGGSAAFAEILVQSSENEITLMPALPDAWKEGSVKGLCARGGFEISMEWKEGKITKASVLSKSGNPCKVIYANKTYDLKIGKGKSADLKF
jgi:alpha-L-fucosidase 2